MLEKGRVYRRRDLHAAFGGQQQGGISTPATTGMIFLFTGDSGKQFGYRDGWTSEGLFRYSGEGQLGDMRFDRGNSAIRDHADRGKTLHLFEKATRGDVRYVGEMVYVRHELVSNVPDRLGNLRTAIVFYLRSSEDNSSG